MIKACLRLLLICSVALFSVPSLAAAKPSFKLCWSIYAGWMPWDYAQQSGIVKKWADKYGIDIQFVQVNDYIESVNQYTAGGYDGRTKRNREARTIPVTGHAETTAPNAGD